LRKDQSFKVRNTYQPIGWNSGPAASLLFQLLWQFAQTKQNCLTEVAEQKSTISLGYLQVIAHNTRSMKDTAFSLKYLEFEKDLLSLEITFHI